MSYSTLYLLNHNPITPISEYGNGWGSAGLVWDYLGKKYIPETPVYSMDRDYLKKVWALHYNDRLEEYERITLRFTFDKAMVPKDMIPVADEHFTAFGVASNREMPGRVNHWESFGNTFMDVHKRKFKMSRYARGIVLSAISVYDPWEDYGQEWFDNAWNIFDVE